MSMRNITCPVSAVNSDEVINNTLRHDRHDALNGNLLGREEDETMTYGTGDHSYQVTGYSALITPTSLTRSQSQLYIG